jgi:hypothetical protein
VQKSLAGESCIVVRCALVRAQCRQCSTVQTAQCIIWPLGRAGRPTGSGRSNRDYIPGPLHGAEGSLVPRAPRSATAHSGARSEERWARGAPRGEERATRNLCVVRETQTQPWGLRQEPLNVRDLPRSGSS